jgi:hypothetical protein
MTITDARSPARSMRGAWGLSATGGHSAHSPARGFVEVAVVQRGSAADDARAIRDALSFAVQSAGAQGQGIAAYDNWVEGLASGQSIAEDGAGYHAAVWSECRAYAGAFLAQARTRLPGRCDNLFDRAREAYGQVRDALEAVSSLFPPCLAAAAPEGQTEDEAQALMAYARDQARRDRAAALVREARGAEEAALALIEQIVDAV